MLSRYATSPFTNSASVEAWDTWFRWRERGALRDASIEATWQRVATTLASVETENAAQFSRRLLNAQASWQLLIDERIIASAGTAFVEWPRDPVALLNVAHFVAAPLTAKASFEFDAFRDTIVLAMRAADNVMLNAGADLALQEPRIGIAGMGDALALLGRRYDSPAGRVLAGTIARTLAETCLRANVGLARERGPCGAALDEALAVARARGMPQTLIDDMQRSGVRYARTTAITSQPRLALFANNVSDALDPLDCIDARPGESNAAARSNHPTGYAFALAQRIDCEGIAATVLNESTGVSVAAQIDLRGAVQPWIDWPIEYPFRVSREPDVRAATHWQRLANAHRLGSLRWSHA
jgi:ribonucleoside-diphosphate reductase alpha chain